MAVHPHVVVQGRTAGPGPINVPLRVDVDGILQIGGSSGGGDASAANQISQIAQLASLIAQIMDYNSGAGTSLQVVFGLSTPSPTGPIGVSTSNPLPIADSGNTPGAPTFATVGVAEAEALAASATRKRVVLVNTSAAFISIAFGANAAVLNSGYTLTPYGVRDITNPAVAALAIRAIASAAASNLGIEVYT